MKETLQSTLKENFSMLESGASHLAETAKPYVEQIVKKGKEVYAGATQTISKDQKKAVAIGIAGVALAVIAYRAGKSRRTSTLPKDVAEASSGIAHDLKPVFKFLKLWMIYKISV